MESGKVELELHGLISSLWNPAEVRESDGVWGPSSQEGGDDIAFLGDGGGWGEENDGNLGILDLVLFYDRVYSSFGRKNTCWDGNTIYLFKVIILIFGCS